MRAAAIAFAVAMLLVFGASSVLAQGTRNPSPTELWENYPLDAGTKNDSKGRADNVPRAAGTTTGPVSEPAPDGGPSPFILVIPGLIVAAGVLLTAVRQRLRGAPLRGLLPRPEETAPETPPAEPTALEPTAAPLTPPAEPTPPGPAAAPLTPAAAPLTPTAAPLTPPAEPTPPEPTAAPLAPPAVPAPPARASEPVAPPPESAPPPVAPLWPAPEPAPPRDALDGSPRRLPSNRFARSRADALGYVTVPAVSDAYREELRRQVKRIRRACEAFELSLVELIPDDESSAPTPAERPGYRRVMRRLDRGEAQCLVTTRVQRLASSAEEWALLLDLLDELEVRLIVVDDALDTGSASGRDEAWRLAGLEAPVTPGRA